MPVQSYFQLLNPLLFSLFAAAFLALSLVSARARAAAFFSASYALGAAAFTVDFFRDAMPEIVGAFLSNVLYTATSATAVIGFCLRYGRTPPMRVLVAAASIGMAFYGWLFFRFDDIAARILGINVVNGVILSIGVVAVAHKIPKLPLDRIAFGFFALLALQCFVRPALVFLVDRPNAIETYTQSSFFVTLHLVVGVIGVGVALTMLAAFAVESLEDFSRRSTVDALTQILTRRGFEERAGDKLAAADAHDKATAVIVADIDRFKAINEAYGHGFGDLVIAGAGALFRSFSHGGRIAGRVGGEAFALLIPEQRLDDARNTAEAMRRKFAATPVGFDGAPKTFTASFGVALRLPHEPLYDALARADEALHLAKERGRNCVMTEIEVRGSGLEGSLASRSRRRFVHRVGDVVKAG